MWNNKPIGSELPVSFTGDWDIIDFTSIVFGIRTAKDNFTTVCRIAGIPVDQVYISIVYEPKSKIGY